MPGKRARTTSSLTGGSYDVKPQILTISASHTIADDYNVTAFTLPISKVTSGKTTKATIIEILKVQYIFSGSILADPTAIDWCYLTTVTTRADAETATAATLSVDAADPRTFAFVVMDGTFSTSGGYKINMAPTVDLTDGNGNGILVATDAMVLVNGNVGGGATPNVSAKIFYRYYEASLLEYIGIVQTQSV